MDVIRKDVIVVSCLGAFGSAALWRLAERGVAAAGIKRYGIGHNLKLFARADQAVPRRLPGTSRSSRDSAEVARTVDQARRAGRGAAGAPNGLPERGRPDSRPVKGTLAAAAASGVPVSEIGSGDLAARQPQYAGLSPDEVGDGSGR